VIVVVAIAALLASPACGKKGPPLAPLLLVPAGVTDLVVRRLGPAVYLEFGVPVENQGGSRPVDLARIDVYGLTTAPEPEMIPPQDARAFMKVATLVARLEIASDPASRVPESEPKDVRLVPGDTATVVERLTPDVVTPVDPRPASAQRAREPRVELSRLAPGLSVGLDPPVRRTYLIIGSSTRGRLGNAVRAEVPLVRAPPPPEAPSIEYAETKATVRWQPAANARRYVQQPGDKEATVIPGRPIIEWPGPWMYEVYEVSEGGDERLSLPRSINTTALLNPEYEDPRVTFGVQRCYAVRSFETFRSATVRSAPSPSACVTFVDTFPPSVPTGLTAVATEGAVSLIWEPSPEKDVAGYLILRARASDETLQPLTFEPVTGTTYRDAGVRAGVRYRYAVQALDGATPPNASGPSEPFEVDAR